jgi:hypothetical protein
MPGKRRQKVIDQSPGHHEQVIEALADESVQNEVSAGSHANSPFCVRRVARVQLAREPGRAKAWAAVC